MQEKSAPTEVTYTRHQQIFIQLFTAVLIDLVVLNLFDEYWDKVVIESFTISLLTAILLQALLRITIRIEHRVSDFFNTLSGGFYKFLKYLSLWLVLFGSKFVILGAIDWAFGDEVLFHGAYHGVITFIVVVVAILLAEKLASKINQMLGLIGKN